MFRFWNRAYGITVRNHHSQAHWYSGLCFCGKCGYAYNAQGLTYLSCKNRQKYGNQKRTAMNGEVFGCDNHSVSERVLMAALKAGIEKIQVLGGILKSNMMLEILSIRKNSGEESIIAKQDEIARLKQKKLKAVDLMIDGLIDKDSLKEQTAFYDNEIERLSNEISNHNNADTIYNEQIEVLTEAINKIQFISESETDNTDLYREIVEKIIIPEYQRLEIYFKGLPFGFIVKYTTHKAPAKRSFTVNIDSCELDY